MKTRVSRRSFVKGSMIAGATAAMPLGVTRNVLGANEKLNAVVAGLNGRGGSHIGGFNNKHGCQIVGLVDPDSVVLNRRVASLKKQNGKCEGYADVREPLDSKDVDIVSIATPNHWHSLMAIWAVQAGKDVYVEKPVSHNVWEGRQLVNAARANKRMVQAGMQSRSSKRGLQEAVDWIAAGNLGKIQYIVGTCFKPRKSIGKNKTALKIPDTVNYDVWCGPAEKRDLFRGRMHYDWHWDTNTGNGDMGNQGIHQMDIARWFLGVNELSPRVMSIGGRVGYDDAGDTPNTQTVIHAYEKAPLIFETRGLPKGKEFQDHKWSRSMDNYRGSRIGVVVQCENGHITCPSYTGCAAFDKDGKQIKKWSGGGDHFGNFVGAVRSRKTSDLNGEVLDGHLSSALCHTGMISHLVGKTATQDEITAQAKTNKAGAESWERIAAHLEANKIDVTKGGIQLGPWLEMDPKTERFTNNDAANKLLTRNYRKGFEVPSIEAVASAG